MLARSERGGRDADMVLHDTVLTSYRNCLCSKYGTFDIHYRIKRVLPFVPVFFFFFTYYTQRKLPCTVSNIKILSIRLLVYRYRTDLDSDIDIRYPTLVR